MAGTFRVISHSAFRDYALNKICDSCMEKLKCVLVTPIMEIQGYGTLTL